jgi:hypothetical protein
MMSIAFAQRLPWMAQRPMERKPSVSLEKLLQAVALGNTETDVISSIAGRLARMDKRLSPEDKAEVQRRTIVLVRENQGAYCRKFVYRQGRF